VLSLPSDRILSANGIKRFNETPNFQGVPPERSLIDPSNATLDKNRTRIQSIRILHSIDLLPSSLRVSFSCDLPSSIEARLKISLVFLHPADKGEHLAGTISSKDDLILP